MNKLEEIDKYLIDAGFTKNNNTYTVKVKGPDQVVIVNGQRMVHNNVQEISFEYVGEGENMTDEVPIYGFKIFGDDVWVEDLDDFKGWFSNLIDKIAKNTKICDEKTNQNQDQ